PEASLDLCRQGPVRQIGVLSEVSRELRQADSAGLRPFGESLGEPNEALLVLVLQLRNTRAAQRIEHADEECLSIVVIRSLADEPELISEVLSKRLDRRLIRRFHAWHLLTWHCAFDEFLDFIRVENGCSRRSRTRLPVDSRRPHEG